MAKVFRISLGLATLFGMLMSAGFVSADGVIDPASVDEQLMPGETLEVKKNVTTPEIPPKIDVCLLEDETGSFWDDISFLQGGTTASDIYDAIVADAPDAQFAVAGFRDYPQAPYGDPGDHVYRLLSSMSAVKADWLSGIAALTADGGNDIPEAQYDAIAAATGPGSFEDPSLGSQPDCGWRADPDVTRVLVVTTDAPFHLPGLGKPHVNDEASAIAALQAQGIVVVGLKATGAAGELDALAAATGGSVQALSSDGSNIAVAILAGLKELTSDVWWEVSCDPELSVSLSPDVHLDVVGGDTVMFDEEIKVEEGTGFGTYLCTVTFYANEYPAEGAVIGVEEISINVPAVPVDIKPTSCRNPLNVKGKGVLPVAILGTSEFDVSMVDPSSVRLAGVVAPLRWDMEDVATPFEPYTGKSDAFDCTEEGPDGYMDLTLKFDSQEVVAELGEVYDGDVLVLQLTGNLMDGRAIAGEDVVVILEKGK